MELSVAVEQQMSALCLGGGGCLSNSRYIPSVVFVSIESELKLKDFSPIMIRHNVDHGRHLDGRIC